MASSAKLAQKAVERSRKAAKLLRKDAAKATGAKRAALLKDARDYEKEADRLVKIYRKEGVK